MISYPVSQRHGRWGSASHWAAVGVAVGLAAATALTRLMATVLFGVQPVDPVTYAIMGVVLMGVGVLATWIPARRAASVDPMTALRHE